MSLCVQSIEEVLALSWSEVMDTPTLVRVIQAILRPCPWSHDVDGPRGTCSRCGRVVSTGADFLGNFYSPCPVPPPITAAPEVVAERLKDEILEHEQLGRLARAESQCGGRNRAWEWYAIHATPPQRVIACLLAICGSDLGGVVVMEGK